MSLSPDDPYLLEVIDANNLHLDRMEATTLRELDAIYRTEIDALTARIASAATQDTFSVRQSSVILEALNRARAQIERRLGDAQKSAIHSAFELGANSGVREVGKLEAKYGAGASSRLLASLTAKIPHQAIAEAGQLGTFTALYELVSGETRTLTLELDAATRAIIQHGLVQGLSSRELVPNLARQVRDTAMGKRWRLERTLRTGLNASVNRGHNAAYRQIHKEILPGLRRMGREYVHEASRNRGRRNHPFSLLLHGQVTGVDEPWRIKSPKQPVMFWLREGDSYVGMYYPAHLYDRGREVPHSDGWGVDLTKSVLTGGDLFPRFEASVENLAEHVADFNEDGLRILESFYNSQLFDLGDDVSKLAAQQRELYGQLRQKQALIYQAKIKNPKIDEYYRSRALRDHGRVSEELREMGLPVPTLPTVGGRRPWDSPHFQETHAYLSSRLPATRNLPDDLREAVARYRGMDYRAVNEALRTGDLDSLTQSQKDTVTKLDRLLEAHKPPAPLTVYRAGQVPGLQGPPTEEALRDLVGKEITEYGYGSTSLDESYSARRLLKDDAVLWEIKVPANSRAYYMAAGDSSPGEAELLLGRGHKLKVESVEWDQTWKAWRVKALAEIPDKPLTAQPKVVGPLPFEQRQAKALARLNAFRESTSPLATWEFDPSRVDTSVAQTLASVNLVENSGKREMVKVADIFFAERGALVGGVHQYATQYHPDLPWDNPVIIKYGGKYYAAPGHSSRIAALDLLGEEWADVRVVDYDAIKAAQEKAAREAARIPKAHRPETYLDQYKHLGSAAKTVAYGRAAMERGLDAVIDKAAPILDSRLKGTTFEGLGTLMRGMAQGIVPPGSTFRQLVEAMEAEAASLMATYPGDAAMIRREIAKVRHAATVHGHLEQVCSTKRPQPRLRFAAEETTGEYRSSYASERLAPPDAPRAEMRDKSTLNLGQFLSPKVKEKLDGKVTLYWSPNIRAYETQRTIHIASNMNSPSSRVIEHEMMHALEETDPKAGRAAADFLWGRTRDESSVKLKDLHPRSNYGNAELARPDKFHDAYVGRIYTDRLGGVVTGPGDLTATEVTSMGVQGVFEMQGSLLLQDEELYFFSFGQMAGVQGRAP